MIQLIDRSRRWDTAVSNPLASVVSGYLVFFLLFKKLAWLSLTYSFALHLFCTNKGMLYCVFTLCTIHRPRDITFTWCRISWVNITPCWAAVHVTQGLLIPGHQSDLLHIKGLYHTREGSAQSDRITTRGAVGSSLIPTDHTSANNIWPTDRWPTLQHLWRKIEGAWDDTVRKDRPPSRVERSPLQEPNRPRDRDCLGR